MMMSISSIAAHLRYEANLAEQRAERLNRQAVALAAQHHLGSNAAVDRLWRRYHHDQEPQRSAAAAEVEPPPLEPAGAGAGVGVRNSTTLFKCVANITYVRTFLMK